MTTWNELLAALREAKKVERAAGDQIVLCGMPTRVTLRRRTAHDLTWVHVSGFVGSAKDIPLADLMRKNATLAVGVFALDGDDCVFQEAVCLDRADQTAILRTVRFVAAHAVENRTTSSRAEHPYAQLYVQ
jgi:hypothetical protein